MNGKNLDFGQEWPFLGKQDRVSDSILGDFYSVCRSSTQAQSKDCTKKRESKHKDNKIDHKIKAPFCKRVINSGL